MKSIMYLGNMEKVAEYIYFNEEFDLICIACENNRIHEGLLTFSLVRNVPLIPLESVKDLEELIIKNGKDAITLSSSFCLRIPMEKLCGYKVFNIHFAELPFYQGRHGDYWATMNNEKYMGVSLHVVTEEFDKGDIISVKKVPWYLWMGQGDVYRELSDCVPILLGSLLKYLDEGSIELPDNRGHYYRSITNKDKIIDIEKDTATDIYNKVRTQMIYRGAGIELGKDFFFIKNIFFVYRNMDKPYCIEGNVLFIKWKNGIAIKSTDFYYGYCE